MNSIFLYFIWLSIPTLYFLIALWGYLERFSNKRGMRQNPEDYIKQGIFVLFCVGICIAIDQYFLAQIVEGFAPEWVPLGFFQALLLPFVLYLAALLIGPSAVAKSKNKKRGGK